MTNFLRYYFYLVSLITLFAWAIGLADLVGAALAVPFGYDFTYSISRTPPSEPAYPLAPKEAMPPDATPQPETPRPPKPGFTPLSPEEQGNRQFREHLASAIPAVVIVLPMWLFHWMGILRRSALRDKLGRFYLLAVLGVSSLVTVIFAIRAIGGLIRHYILVPPLDPWMPLGPAVGNDIGFALVFAAIWVYHLLILQRHARAEATTVQPAA